MKKEFITPLMEVIEFEAEDIIVTSSTDIEDSMQD